MATRRSRSETKLSAQGFTGNEDGHFPAEMSSTAHMLQQLLAERLPGKDERGPIMPPRHSTFADQIDVLASTVSRISGPMLLIVAILGLGRLIT